MTDDLHNLIVDNNLSTHDAEELLKFDAFLRWPADALMPGWMVEYCGLPPGQYKKPVTPAPRPDHP